MDDLPAWIVDIMQDQDSVPVWIPNPVNDGDMPISSVAFFDQRNCSVAIGNSGQDPSHRWVRHSQNPLLHSDHFLSRGRYEVATELNVVSVKPSVSL
jgi:hypothetical protein